MVDNALYHVASVFRLAPHLVNPEATLVALARNLGQ